MSPKLSKSDALAALLAGLAAPGTTPLHAQRTGGPLDALTAPHPGRIAHYSSRDTTGGNDDYRTIAPGATLTLVDHHGAGVVRRWWVTIAPRNDHRIQRQLIVRCWWDDETEPSVEVPISDFFGVGFGEWQQYTSAPMNMTSGGYDTYWPMPFRRHARITVENRSAVAVGSFYYNVDIETRPTLDDSTLYFHAQFRRTTTVAGQPVTLLDATGRGQYVGSVISMQPLHGRSLGFLEGDERVFVDGEAAPSIVGTGTEDYFSSGWYFDTGPYSSLYHGLTIKDSLTGRVSAYRWHIEDPIPFTRALRFTIEHGGTNDAPRTDYSTVAFWYQTHPHAPFPALPADLLPDTTTSAVMRIPRMIEAESLLAVARVSAGELRVQDMSGFEPDSALWSGGTQLWWVLARPGARLTLPIRVRTGGVHELTGYFTRARDYGDVRVSLNGRPLAPIVRGYAPQVEATGPISFGRVPFRSGANTLVVEIVGKDPRAAGYSGGYLVGIDGIAIGK
ncbi:MAG: DUF2961 domain-containing protein [Gemmatimonadaceae bacterium]|nr:DUF2961 domain-containing protein [Gemmatimonadaceae bacterium]